MSEHVKALGMALGSNNPERWGGKPPMATCPGCDEPLVGTFDWPGYEFVCVCCGRHLGFVEQKPAESTPTIEARHAELDQAFRDAKESGAELQVWLRERVSR